MDSSIDNILALYDQDAPLEMAYTIPAAWYVDERIAHLENAAGFRQQLDRRRANRPGGRRRTIFYF